MFRFIRHHKTLTFACSLALLVALGWMLPVTTADLWDWGARVSGHPLAMVGVVLVMAALMTFGLPGSLCFWVIAPFHPLLLSVCMLLIGSVGGALGAYYVGTGLRNTWRTGDMFERLVQLLGKRSDLLTQCALRIMPGVPHALINLAAGVLRLPLITFTSAAILGLGMKWAVYSHAVQGMVSASQAEEALELGAVLPLIVLGVLLVLGRAAQRYWFFRRGRDGRADHGSEGADS